MQVEIENTLRPYFGRFYTASFISKQTGLDIKTVCNYVNKFTKKIRDSEDKDFLTRQENDRQCILLVYDDMMLREDFVLNEIAAEFQKYKNSGKRIPESLINTCNKTVRLRADLVKEKGLFSMQPTFNEALEKRNEEAIA